MLSPDTESSIATASANVNSQPQMTQRLSIEPLDPLITSIQPGGGFCMKLELAWGQVRRRYLKTFRPGYVARMAKLRRGDKNACPFEVLDPRDVKFYRNQGGYYWEPQDDPFTWRDHLGFARVGLTELWMISGAFFAVSSLLGWLFWPLAPVPVVLGLYRLVFRIPAEIPERRTDCFTCRRQGSAHRRDRVRRIHRGPCTAHRDFSVGL